MDTSRGAAAPEKISLLSVVIPVYNEAATVHEILDAVEAVELEGGVAKELVLVDDCSKDGSAEAMERWAAERGASNVRILRHERNMGKGAALHTGIAAATGQAIVVQDADLEYDPREYNALLRPLLENRADVVYGSRFMGGNPHRVLFFWHSFGNKLLTLISNAFSDLNLTDMETCYKLFRAPILQGLKLEENRFGFEPEVTAKVSRVPGVRICEVGISYYGRTYAEGKKIGWKDGFRAIWCILRYNLFR